MHPPLESRRPLIFLNRRMPKLAVNAQCNELQHIPRRWKRPRRRGRIFSAAALLWGEVALRGRGRERRADCRYLPPGQWWHTRVTHQGALVTSTSEHSQSGNLPLSCLRAASENRRPHNLDRSRVRHKSHGCETSKHLIHGRERGEKI